jgi:Protein of unknown function (DUF3037)
MSKETTYTYTTLRYVHDITTGEFVNVGIALYAPEHGYAVAKCRKTTARVKSVFPSLNASAFKDSLRYVESKFKEVQDDLKQSSNQFLFSNSRKTALDIALNVISKDDSALQWSSMGSGLTSDPQETLEYLYKRMVATHEQGAKVTPMQDSDVWMKFSSALQNRALLDHFKAKTISVQDDEITFKHAWKNGVWHCLEPVSLDLSSSNSIKSKVHKWLGQLASVSEANERFKVYFLLGGPSQSELSSEVPAAANILKKSDRTGEVFLESDTKKFAELIAQVVEQREPSVSN